MRLAKNLIVSAIRAPEELRVPHRRARDEVVSDFVIALRELEKPLSHLFAMMRR